VNAPLVSPITLPEVKFQLRIEHDEDDALITRLIDLATAFADVKGVLGKAMITQTWADWMGPNPTQSVQLLLGPVQSVNAVKYYDVDGNLQTDTLSNYNLFGLPSRKIVEPKSGFNWPVTQDRDDAIQIEYVIGYGDDPSDVPRTVRHALMLMVGHWYENREQTQMDQLADIPFGFMELINIHKESWYG
jgi:uncharacterized phiE125 gp8 family phage protein